MSATIKARQQVLDYVNMVTDEFVETGVAYLRVDYTDESVPTIIQGPSVRAYLRAVAKEMKRPFVVARKIRWHSSTKGADGRWRRDKNASETRVELTIPKKKGMELIAAPFIVGATCEPGGDAVARVGDSRKPTWCFNFCGDQGVEIFEEWLSGLRNCPKRRAVLKL